MAQTTMESIANDIEWIKNTLKDMKEGQADYVTKDEFWPVKTIVYGGASIILVAVVGAIVALVVKQ